MLLRARYFLNKAFDSIVQSPGVSFLTTATITASLLLLGLYVTGLQNMEQLTLRWGRAASVTAYLDEALPPATWQTVADAIAGIDGVASVALVPPEAALARFRARGSDEAELVEGVDVTLLPAAIELTLRAGFADLGVVGSLAQQIDALTGVAEVDYGRDELRQVQRLLELLRWGGALAGLLLFVAVAFIVSNTVRLTVYARRDEIIIQRLVGATRWFVQAPFLLEGLIWGGLAALLATTALWAGDLWLAPLLSRAAAQLLGTVELFLFTPVVAIVLLPMGLLLGSVGSALAVRRFIDLDTER